MLLLYFNIVAILITSLEHLWEVTSFDLMPRYLQYKLLLMIRILYLTWWIQFVQDFTRSCSDYDLLIILSDGIMHFDFHSECSDFGNLLHVYLFYMKEGLVKGKKNSVKWSEINWKDKQTALCIHTIVNELACHFDFLRYFFFSEESLVNCFSLITSYNIQDLVWFYSP